MTLGERIQQGSDKKTGKESRIKVETIMHYDR